MKTKYLAWLALFIMFVSPTIGAQSETVFAKSKRLVNQESPLRLWYDRPAQFFEESLPIGNGRLGALVYGNPTDDIIYLNDITLWTGSPVDQNEGEGAAAWIPMIREALWQEDYARADSLQLHVQGHNSQFYQPLATLHLRDLAKGDVTDYRRVLDLDSSLVQISYNKGNVRVCREYFASNPDQAIAIHIVADRIGSLDQEIMLTSQVPHHARASLPQPRHLNDGSVLGWQGQLTLTGHATGDPQQSIHYCSHLLLKTPDGHVEAHDSTLRVTGATELTIYFVNRTSFNGSRSHPVSEGAPYMEQASDDAWRLLNHSIREHRERHVADYRRYYDRVKLRIGNKATSEDALPTNELLLRYTDAHDVSSSYLEELYFQYGRYLLISSSRTPGVPANLQGLWAPNLWSPWRGNYTMNINLEENYWPAFVSNLAEMATPLDGFITALSENGRHTAHHFYGIDNGWCASHNSDIWAMTNPVGEQNEKPEWANWNMGGAWLVNTLWERYLFTQDKEYLRNVAFPLMKGAANFCLDWLIENPNKPGELITAPSTSPENEYVTENGYHGMTCYGGTVDLAIIRELFANTIAAHKILVKHGDKQNSWGIVDDCLPLQIAFNKLHPYTIGHKGDLNEWYYDWRDWDPKHRHQSHLIGLYPGNHLSETSLLKACEQTLIEKGDETTGWSTGWRINLWARLKDGEKAYHVLQKLLTYVSPDGYDGPDKRRSGGTYPNLMDAHPPFQIDGNFGGTAGICEMLVQSRVDETTSLTTLELLPALPKAWSDGSVSGLCARGGYEVDIDWADHRVTRVCIRSIAGGKIAILANGKKQTLTMKPRQTKVIKLKK